VSNDHDSVEFGTITGMVEFVPEIVVLLTGIISVEVLFEDEASVDSVFSAGVEEDEALSVEVVVLS